MTQNMPLNYQLRLLKQLCYIPGPDSWWITFGIIASRGDWLSAASAVIDLPRRERQILEAGFDSLPQQHNSVYLDWSLHHWQKTRTPDPRMCQLLQELTSMQKCCIQNWVSTRGLCLPNISRHWDINHCNCNCDCNLPPSTLWQVYQLHIHYSLVLMPNLSSTLATEKCHGSWVSEVSFKKPKNCNGHDKYGLLKEGLFQKRTKDQQEAARRTT